METYPGQTYIDERLEEIDRRLSELEEQAELLRDVTIEIRTLVNEILEIQ